MFTSLLWIIQTFYAIENGSDSPSISPNIRGFVRDAMGNDDAKQRFTRIRPVRRIETDAMALKAVAIIGQGTQSAESLAGKSGLVARLPGRS